MYSDFKVDDRIMRCRVIQQDSQFVDDALVIVSAVYEPGSCILALLILERITGEDYAGEIVNAEFVRDNYPWASHILLAIDNAEM